MKNVTTSFEATDGTSLCLERWGPDGAPAAVLHIAHGMGEHARRYARFASALAEHDVVVYAHDHRGHGHSVAGPDGLGVFGPDGWNQLVRDLSAVHASLREAHPGLPLVAFGHSMGSFALQQLLLDESHLLAAAVLSGSAAVDPLFGAMDVSKPASFEGFNDAFAPARTDADWLSRDPDEVDLYVADPLCGFGVCAAALRDMAAAAPRMADPDALARIRSELPLYVMAGSADPVNHGLELLDLMVQRYREAGLKALTLRTYPDARHELLNETNRDEVTRDFVGWLRSVLAL